MTRRLWRCSVALAGAVLLLYAAPARADVADQLTYFTFSSPVELPGVVLPPGTYMFKRLDTNDPRVVEVANASGRVVYGIFLTTAEARVRSANSAVTFTEAPADAPERVKAWFYTGRKVGDAFIYPRSNESRSVESSR